MKKLPAPDGPHVAVATRCTICNHPDRDKINQDIIDTSIRATCEKWGLGRGAVSAHRKNHLIEATVEEVILDIQAEDVEIGLERPGTNGREPIDETLKTLNVVLEAANSAAKRARTVNSLGHEMAALREARATIEAIAKIEFLRQERFLDEEQLYINSKDWVELRTVLLTVLEKYPKVKREVEGAIEKHLVRFTVGL
jgi:hypothetical protein